MSEKIKVEMPPQEEKLVFQQTKNGIYDSFPLAEDIMEEMGIEDPEKEEASTSYAERAMNDGHGEYISNVKKAAEFCKARGAKTKEDIEKILNEAEIEQI